MLRNRMLGGVSFLSFVAFAPEGVAGGGNGGEDDKHTDVLLQEIASRVFDDAAAAADTGAGARTPEKAAGAEKAPVTAREPAEGAKRAERAPAADDRGDGRTPRGQFAKKPPAEGEAERIVTPGVGKADPAAVAKAGELPGQDQQQDAPKAAPPGGWSVASKAAWDKLPDSVRADIAKRELEVSTGFKEFEGLKPFAARAKENGQSLTAALTAYTGIEDLIRRDAGAGLMHIANNAGLTQAEQATLFARLAQRMGFQFPQAPGAQPAGGSPGDQNPAADPNALQKLLEPVLQPLTQKLNEIDAWRTQTAEGEKTQRRTASQQVVETFRQSPEGKFYDNLEPTIFSLLQGGVVPRTGNLAADLKSAYDYACRIHPEISELLLNERIAASAGEKRTNEQQATDRARAASRSVTGAPAAGAREISRRKGDSLQSLAEQAYDAAAGRV